MATPTCPCAAPQNRGELDLPALWQRLSVLDLDAAPRLELLRQGHTRRTFRLQPANAPPLILKHWFRQRQLWRPGGGCGSNSMDREAAMTRLACDRGVAAYRPLAMEHRGFGPWRQSLLVLPCLSATQTLADCLSDPGLTDAVRQQVLHRFGETLARVHQANLCHQDYKPDNVLLAGADPATSPFLVIDWGQAQEVAADDQATRLADLTASCQLLAAVVASPGGCAPFFDGYAAATPWFAASRQDLTERVLAPITTRLRANYARAWQRCLCPGRRLRLHRTRSHRLFVLVGESWADAAAALAGQPTILRADEGAAEEVWRAASVLRAAGQDSGGVVAFARERRWFGAPRTAVVYRPGPRPYDPAVLIRRGRELLENPWPTTPGA